MLSAILPLHYAGKPKLQTADPLKKKPKAKTSRGTKLKSRVRFRRQAQLPVVGKQH